MKINVEGGELVLRNEHGDTVIVPRERRKEAMSALLKDDYRAIDSLALQLPKASRYAENGSLIVQKDPGKDLLRPDGTKKGKGFYGNLPNKNGDISSELSISSSDIENGKEVLIPTLIPGLSKTEIDYLLSNKYNPQSREGVDDKISRKAINFAKSRKQQGFPYFAHDIEEGAFKIPKYAAGGTVLDGQDPPVEGIMGPETTITASRPKKSIGNFFRRWGYEHSKEGSDSLLGAIGSGLGAALQLPQAAVTYMLDPKGNVKPSKALAQNGITAKLKDLADKAGPNSLGGLFSLLANEHTQDIGLDPLLASGKISKVVSRGAELVNGLGKEAAIIGDGLGAKYLPNAYKLNPKAIKELEHEILYRTQPKNFVKGVTEEQELKNLITDNLLKGKETPWYVKGKLMKIQHAPEPFREALNTYHGQWFDKNPERMKFYMEGRLDGEEGDILRTILPKNKAAKYNVNNIEEAQKASLNYNTEFILPSDDISRAEKFSTHSLPELLNQHKDFTVPHWRKGYKEIPKNIINDLQGAVSNTKSKQALLDFSSYPTPIEAAKLRAERLLSQEHKMVDSHAIENLKNIDNNFEAVNGRDNFYNPANLGRNTGEKAIIYTDSPLSVQNQAKIAAHEVGHFYRNSFKEGQEWNSFFDFKGKGLDHKTKKYFQGKGMSGNGSMMGDEIKERAAQLKDFIAHKNNIPLNKDFTVTEAHLDDAIKNYVKETGLNNNMTEMLSGLVDKKGFLKAMNNKPLAATGTLLTTALANKNKTKQ